MKTIIIQEPINLKVVRFELDFTQLNTVSPKPKKKCRQIKIPEVFYKKNKAVIPSPPLIKSSLQKRDTKELVEDLLDELYANQRNWSGSSLAEYQGSIQAGSTTSSISNCGEHTDAIERSCLEALDINELREQMMECTNRLQITGERLARCVRIRDRLRRKQKRLCAAFTVLLRHICNYNDD